MNIDIETLLLLLSAVLGLSLIVERILQGVKWLVGQMLFHEDSLLEEKEEPVESLIGEMTFRKVNDKLDDILEEIEEQKIKLQDAVHDEKGKIQDKVSSLEEQAAEFVKKYNDLFKNQIIFNRKQKKEIEDKQKYLEGRFRGSTVDPSWGEYDEKYYQPTVLVDKMDLPDPEKTARLFWLQIIGALSGIIICHFSEFGIFHHFLEKVSPQLDWILTGILIGGGSQPIHTLIKFVQSRKRADMVVSNQSEVEYEEQPVKKLKEPPSTSQKEVSPEPIIDIKYRGGVDREKLEHIHHRRVNPDLIIYHHTAMHSDTTFEDVVKVIKDRDWSTGYNCVVL